MASTALVYSAWVILAAAGRANFRSALFVKQKGGNPSLLLHEARVASQVAGGERLAARVIPAAGTRIRKTSAVIIRDRSSDDAAILEAIARETHRVDGYPKYMPEDLRSFIVDEDALGAWVAQNDHEILGHVALHRRSEQKGMEAIRATTGLEGDHVAVVARLLVSPAARRRGAGRALLDRAVEEARRLGRRAVLDVVDEHVAAIALYERAGWTPVGKVDWSLPGDRLLREFVFLSPEPG